MKKTILLISVAFLLVAAVDAQFTDWPTHPMDTRTGDKPEYLIETFGYRDSLERLQGGFDLHRYSPDGYIDTIYGNMYTMINFYSKETNKLIKQDYYSGLIGQHPVYEWIIGNDPISSSSLFEYDDQGRRIAQHTTSYIYDLDDNLIKTEETTDRHDFSTVDYTDSQGGYIYNGQEHVFDEQGRLIQVLYEGGKTDFTYFDDNKGFERITHQDDPDIEDPPAQLYKEVHFFNEKGLLINSRTYRKFDHQTEWTFWYNEFFDYTFYEDDGSTTQSNQEIERIHQVYGIEGAIRIQAGQPEWVSVYSMAGQLVHRQYVSESATLDLPKAIYIVTAGKESLKVMVR